MQEGAPAYIAIFAFDLCYYKLLVRYIDINNSLMYN